MHDPRNQSSAHLARAEQFDLLAPLQPPSAIDPINLIKQVRDERLIASLEKLASLVQSLPDRIDWNFRVLLREAGQLPLDLFGSSSLDIACMSELAVEIGPEGFEEAWEFFASRTDTIEVARDDTAGRALDLARKGTVLLDSVGVAMTGDTISAANLKAILEEKVSGLDFKGFVQLATRLYDMNKDVAHINTDLKQALEVSEEMKRYAVQVVRTADGEEPASRHSSRFAGLFGFMRRKNRDTDALAEQIVQLLEEADEVMKLSEELDKRLENFEFLGQKVMRPKKSNPSSSLP